MKKKKKKKKKANDGTPKCPGGYEQIKTASNSSKTIKNLINNKNKITHFKSEAGIYAIQYLDCNPKYVDKKFSNLRT